MRQKGGLPGPSMQRRWGGVNRGRTGAGAVKREGNRANRNYLEICLSSSQKNRNSLAVRNLFLDKNNKQHDHKMKYNACK